MLWYECSNHIRSIHTATYEGIARLFRCESWLVLRRGLQGGCWLCEIDISLHMGLCSHLEWRVLPVAQDNGVQQPSAPQQLQQIHTPQSIDQELARLTKDLELTEKQQQQIRSLLQKHHDKIQALLDTNPTASRQELVPHIHAISDETHREIHALLSDHQRQLEKEMQQREHHGEENRRPVPPADIDKH